MAEILFGVVYRAVVAGCNGGCGYGSERGFGYGFGDYGGSEYGDGLGYGFGVFGNCYTDGSGEGWYVPDMPKEDAWPFGASQHTSE